MPIGTSSQTDSRTAAWAAAEGPRLVGRAVFQILAVAGVFFLFSSAAVPDVNEAHYWTKAKHFWDPQFCPGDSFLSSADAHWSFYMTLGQWTRVLPLEQAVWCGRCTVWLAMATGWWALTRVFAFNTLAMIGSAALLVVATRWGHLSGEWVVGGAEAKGLAFAWVFASVAAATSQRWARAYLFAGIAAGFHVLAGGWVVLCLLLVAGTRLMCVAWPQCMRPRSRPVAAAGKSLPPESAASLLLGLTAGGVASLAGLLPALALTWGQAAEVNQTATQAYVLQRLPHHLVFWAFSPLQLCQFCLLLLVWLAVVAGWPAASASEQDEATTDREARRVLMGLVHAALLLAGLGVLLSLAVLSAGPWSQSAVAWLRYYWFRTADVLLPAGTVILLCQAWQIGWSVCSAGFRPAARRWGLVASLALALCAVTWEGWLSYHQAVRDPRPNADKASLPTDVDPQRTAAIARHWQNVCQWIQTNTPYDALFLTPRGQQTFKWYAQRSEVVSWKDVPQDSEGIAEWQRRVNAVAPLWSNDLGVAVADPVVIHELVERYSVTHLVMTQYAYELQTRWGRPLPYARVYPTSAQERTYYVVLDTRVWRSEE